MGFQSKNDDHDILDFARPQRPLCDWTHTMSVV